MLRSFQALATRTRRRLSTAMFDGLMLSSADHVEHLLTLNVHARRFSYQSEEAQQHMPLGNRRKRLYLLMACTSLNYPLEEPSSRRRRGRQHKAVPTLMCSCLYSFRDEAAVRYKHSAASRLHARTINSHTEATSIANSQWSLHSFYARFWPLSGCHLRWSAARVSSRPMCFMQSVKFPGPSSGAYAAPHLLPDITTLAQD